MADTNLIVAYVIQSADTVLATRVRESDRDWVVPPWAPAEFLNVMLENLRRGKMTDRQIPETLAAFRSLVVVEADAEPSVTLNLALTRRLSAYDAGFATLAQRLGCLCVTFDRQLYERVPALAKHPSIFLSQTSSNSAS